MKSRQFCSVCKDWLDMEVVPTNDGDDDDGVVWYRCPNCQGFLPKLKDASEEEAPVDSSAKSSTEDPKKSETIVSDTGQDGNLPWDSPAAMMNDLKDSGNTSESDDDVLVGVAFDSVGEPVGSDVVEETTESKQIDSDRDSKTKPKEDPEPILEYAAMLAQTDVAEAAPYRPWQTYEVGQCINHLAWNDCGVVVSKEVLPGGRNIIKCYFEEAGVVRLIEQAPR